MELYIKCNKKDSNLKDITYMSELIRRRRINSPKQLTDTSVA